MLYLETLKIQIHFKFQLSATMHHEYVLNWYLLRLSCTCAWRESRSFTDNTMVRTVDKPKW